MGKMSELDISRQELEDAGYVVTLPSKVTDEELLSLALFEASRLLEKALVYARNPYIDGETEFDTWQREVRVFLDWHVAEA